MVSTQLPLDPAGWRFATRPGWPEALAQAAAASPPLARPGEPPDPLQRVAARLAAIGGRLQEARADWAAERYPDDPLDAQVATWWRRWAAGDPFRDQARWVRLLDKPVVGAFRHALAARPLPPDVVARAIGDLRDALFYQLLGGRDGGSGFAEIAAWLVETAPGGPVAPLVRALSAPGRATVAGCVSRRGHWPQTLEHAVPDAAGPAERALSLQRAEPADAEGWVELHVALRLVAAWAEDAGSEERDWAIVQQNVGRSRGRLRAVLAREPRDAMVEAVVGLDGLTERTRAAARRWGWAWAWEALSRGFSFDLDQPVIRPCRAEAGVEPLDADDLAALEVWFVLAVLRGRGATVRRWCTEGRGDSDGTWGRLLLELPEGLRDPDGGYVRVRAALAEQWDARCVATDGWLAAIAALPPGRRLKDAFWDVSAPRWDAAVARPKAGFPTFVAHAAAWVRSRGAVRPGSETADGVPRPGEAEA